MYHKKPLFILFVLYKNENFFFLMLVTLVCAAISAKQREIPLVSVTPLFFFGCIIFHYVP